MSFGRQFFLSRATHLKKTEIGTKNMTAIGKFDPNKPSTDLCDLPATEARRMIADRTISPVELMESCLKRVGQTNSTLNAIVTLDEEAGMKIARQKEAELMTGEPLGLLHGLPMVIKDNRDTAGMRTTHGSLLFADHIPDQDDPTVKLVRDAGSVIFGKTNLPEFGAGGNTVNRLFGTTCNPYDSTLTCGGSSGGAAVAVATGMTMLATGSDYGGSLRTPASFCGIVGFRPTPGVAPSSTSAAALSPWGVNGPMGRTVADCHLLLSAQASFDRRDLFSTESNVKIIEPLAEVDLRDIRVAVSSDLGCAPVCKSIVATFEARMKVLSGEFGSVEETAPNFDGIHKVFDVFRGIAFIAAHGDLVTNHRAQLDRNVIANVEQGRRYNLQDVADAQKLHTRIYRENLGFFDDFDVMICPAAAVSPFPHTQAYVDEINDEKMPNYMSWLALSYAPTMAFGCSAVLPFGCDDKGLPFGIQVIGAKGADHKVLQIAQALESVIAGQSDIAAPKMAAHF